MMKKYWLITLSLVLLLSAALLTAASCNLVQRPTANTTVTQVSCNAQRASTTSSGSPTTTNQCSRRLLVFSKTGGFRHASIKDGKIALQKLATEHNFSVDFTEDATAFTDVNLAHYDAVVFLLTTGKMLDDNQKAAFERYIRAGGGYVGVHSASDTEYAWSWYGGLLGAYFDRIHGHSKVVRATIHVIDRNHPSTLMLPVFWVRTDEWYNFASNPRGKVNVLMTIDESTYKGGAMGADHPIAWYHEYDGGRAWYTALGHTSESYSEPLFLAHLWGGILYASGGTRKEATLSRAVEERDMKFLVGSMTVDNVTKRNLECLKCG